MATTSISGLPETLTINSATVGPFDYVGSTYKVTVGTLGSFITNNATTVSATGNVTAGNVTAIGVVNAATHAGTTISVTGDISGANVILTKTLTVNSSQVATGIANGAGNGVGNIGGLGAYFNQVFAQATTALYADLAEVYEADADYTPGTVMVFGGNKEITVTNNSHDTAVAGIISTNPSYLMNAGQSGEWILPVALTGRVPCRVQGPVNKGTVLVTGDIPGTAMALDKEKFEPGCVVGKSLEIIDSTDIVTIEVAVGRL